jgi:hypothetical protein
MPVIVTAAPPRFDCRGDRPWLAGGLEFGGQPSLEARVEGGRREHAGLSVWRHRQRKGAERDDASGDFSHRPLTLHSILEVQTDSQIDPLQHGVDRLVGHRHLRQPLDLVKEHEGGLDLGVNVCRLPVRRRWQFRDLRLRGRQCTLVLGISLLQRLDERWVFDLHDVPCGLVEFQAKIQRLRLERGAGELVWIHRLFGLAACQLLNPSPQGLAAADLIHLLPQGCQRESGELLAVHAVAVAFGPPRLHVPATHVLGLSVSHPAVEWIAATVGLVVHPLSKGVPIDLLRPLPALLCCPSSL